MRDTPVEIAQNEWEFDILLDLYRRTKPEVVLEIGSWMGGTLYHWFKEANWGVKVITIDFIKTEERELWDGWVGENQSLYPLLGNSRLVVDVVKTWVDKIDWLFIDGDHGYEGCKQDYNNYYPMLSPEGYCIFHDIVGESDVKAFWNEIKADDHNKRPTIEICHSRHQLGIGVIQNKILK